MRKEFLLQFISYFFVGLCAALVEWGGFWLFNGPFGLNIYISTGAAFLIATYVNWILARKTAFKKEARHKNAASDAAAVFIVSGIGLGLNLLLMALLAERAGLYPVLAKILATGVVFLWNFAARKFLIYKQ